MKKIKIIITSTFGLVVESVPTKHGSRVRFPEGASFFFLSFIREKIKFLYNIPKLCAK